MRSSSVFAPPSQTAPTTDHRSRLLRWFGWRRLPVARPASAASATQLPSGECGANTCTRPISALAMPATTRPMQKARKATSARPARCVEAAIAITSTAGRMVPTAESESVEGTAPKTDAASALMAVSVIAASSASAPRERGHAEPGRHVASTIRKPPQPTRAAAWLKKVADGATLNAMRVGTATARTAPTASAQAGTGAGREPVADPRTGAARFKAVSP